MKKTSLPPPPAPGAESAAYYGLDVAKATLVLHGPAGPLGEWPNTASGHARLLALVPAQGRVICEATGGYERAVVAALQGAGRHVSVINPRQSRAAAQAQGRRAKSDRIDAADLADYGRRFTPAATPAPTPAEQVLQELVRRRAQLVAARTAAQNQLEHLRDPRLRRQAQRRLRADQRDLAQLEAWIGAALSASEELAARAARLQQLTGIGPTVAAVALAEVPELGRTGDRQIAHLFGLAPFVRESGCWRGQRRIAGGRAAPRAALYMAALSAIVHNRRLREFHQRLLGAGKVGKVALVAVMRKMACLLNRLLRDPHFQLAA